MSRSSDSAATEPLAALVAVAAVCAGVSLYAGALEVPPTPSDPEVAAEKLLDRVHDRARRGGAVDADALGPALRAVHPPGPLEVRVTLVSRSVRRSVGPEPPSGAAARSRRVSVRHGPGRVRPGRLRVVVW